MCWAADCMIAVSRWLSVRAQCVCSLFVNVNRFGVVCLTAHVCLRTCHAAFLTHGDVLCCQLSKLVFLSPVFEDPQPVYIFAPAHLPAQLNQTIKNTQFLGCIQNQMLTQYILNC